MPPSIKHPTFPDKYHAMKVRPAKDLTQMERVKKETCEWILYRQPESLLHLLRDCPRAYCIWQQFIYGEKIQKVFHSDGFQPPFDTAKIIVDNASMFDLLFL
jgi:hypothetical protein